MFFPTISTALALGETAEWSLGLCGNALNPYGRGRITLPRDACRNRSDYMVFSYAVCGLSIYSQCVVHSSRCDPCPVMASAGISIFDVALSCFIKHQLHISVARRSNVSGHYAIGSDIRTHSLSRTRPLTQDLPALFDTAPPYLPKAWESVLFEVFVSKFFALRSFRFEFFL